MCRSLEDTDHIFVLEAKGLDGIDDIWVLLAAGVAIGSLGRVPCIRALDEAEAGQDDHEHSDEDLHDSGSLCYAMVSCYRIRSLGRGFEGQVSSSDLTRSNAINRPALFLWSVPSLSMSICMSMLASSCYKEERRWYCVLTLAIHGWR